MTHSDVIIIGAGICGLMAARETAKKGRSVILLEARDRIGGRIFTSSGEGFSAPVEKGAEFVHGELPLTGALLKEAGLTPVPMEGKTYQAQNGTLRESDEFIEGFRELLRKLESLKTDMTLSDFLEAHFPDAKFAELRNSVTRYAQGYDASDISRVSSIALREEWDSEGSTAPVRIKEGYIKLVDFLAGESKSLGCRIYTSSVAKEIRWQAGSVEVFCENGERFSARKALFTIPLGVLQAPEESRAYVRFRPGLPEAFEAFKSMGFGSAIKLFLEFQDPFWNKLKAPELGFLLSEAEIPTWWTQLPESVPVLTGWIAGPDSDKLAGMSEEEIIARALNSLSNIFGMETESLKAQLVSSKAVNWNKDPFSLGAYAYTTVKTKEALEKASEPVQNTIYFAGEAFYEGPAMGTVEAALTSGAAAAGKL
ncbi:MAG: FAD-dependent oxidoreductase [Ignavibacteria bacterium]|jgi:monoamine oxidase|nr:FAD-dependent oxidoreductase [Ignavibacteria bacterium]MCU7502828.1 FAD-dependent oxidoreductase [Ignavibacteria bacterium]MCU7515678.1 FAD-dependent oxidoreductase [Ignavibacteria bacterium]